MAMNKKEKTLVIVLGLLVYLFAFIKFVMVNSVPRIKDIQQRRVEVQSRKDALEADYRNLDAFKTELAAKTTVDERLGEYLMNHAGLADSIEFIEKLALMMSTEIEKVSLGQPAEISGGNSSKYYGFPIKFDACFSFDELEEFIKYCEGGSKKVRISGYKIQPAKDHANITEQWFDTSMNLVFYSLDKDAADSLFRFSRSKLQEFKSREGTPIFIKDDGKLPEADLPGQQSSPLSYNTEPPVNPVGDISKTNADFIFFHQGYLFGGFNFETYASFNSKERIRRTIEGKLDVLLTVKPDSYSIVSTSEHGITQNVSGNIPNKNFTMHIESNIDTRVKENERLQLDIKVQNESDNSIRVKIDQTGNRIKLMDRDGNEIQIKSEKEKVYL